MVGDHKVNTPNAMVKKQETYQENFISKAEHYFAIFQCQRDQKYVEVLRLIGTSNVFRQCLVRKAIKQSVAVGPVDLVIPTYQLMLKATWR